MRSQIESFARRGAAARMETMGVEVRFRGEIFNVLMSSQPATIDLQVGGFRESQSCRVRFSGDLQPPPAVREEIVEIASGRKFYVTGCVPASGLNVNHIVDARTT